MIRTDIETIIMASGPMPSTIILRERKSQDSPDTPLRALSIQTGSYEAAAISRGIEAPKEARPISHDLLLEAVHALDAKVERVEITRVEAPVYFASVVLTKNQNGGSDEFKLDARPSDALAVAVRENAPIYVEDDVMNRTGTISLHKAGSSDDELERFDSFVETLTPDDF